MAKLKVAILQCDDVLEKFQDRFSNYPEMIIDSFSSALPGLSFDVFDVRIGSYPENLDDYDLYVITGSKASVYDHNAWIQKLVSFVQRLSKQAKPVFGICFGHQIIALAMGCVVQKAEQGWGVGIASTNVTEFGRSIGIDGTNLNMIVSHQDQVMNISENAKLISSSEFCPYFSVKWSSCLISIQGHPEWRKDYSEALMNDRRDRIPANVIEVGIASLSKPLNNTTFIKLMLRDLITQED